MSTQRPPNRTAFTSSRGEILQVPSFYISRFVRSAVRYCYSSYPFISVLSEGSLQASCHSESKQLSWTQRTLRSDTPQASSCTAARDFEDNC